MPAVEVSGSSLLGRLRNMEEFAALGQFLFCFGTDVLGLPDFGREELETEFLAPESSLINTIKMSLLKMVSSRRGLMPDQFEEYTRRQYRSRRPGANPFGDDEEATKFSALDVFDRVKVLYQLSLWIFQHPDRVRDKMKDCDEKEQLTWRMEPCGFDRKGNTYYMLDDNRLYRRTSWIPIERPVKKAKQKKGTKKRRVSAAVEDPDEAADDSSSRGAWSCVCASLHDWTAFVDSLQFSKDPDEKGLYAYLKEDVLPELSKAWLEKEKQRQLMEAVANRKKSSRLDAKLARLKEEEERAAARRREEELEKAARRERMEAEKKERERGIRVKMREQKIKERELRKLQKNDSLSRGTSTDGSSASATRRSSKRVKVEPKAVSEKEWIFDCICGVHGLNYEDGSEIIACDSCDVWQHLSCQNLAPGAENEDFICDLCKRYKKSQDGPKGPNGLPLSPQIIKIRIGRPSLEKPRGRSPPMAPHKEAMAQKDMVQVQPADTAD